jgi:hypothetical protein
MKKIAMYIGLMFLCSSNQALSLKIFGLNSGQKRIFVNLDDDEVGKCLNNEKLQITGLISEQVLEVEVMRVIPKLKRASLKVNGSMEGLAVGQTLEISLVPNDLAVDEAKARQKKRSKMVKKIKLRRLKLKNKTKSWAIGLRVGGIAGKNVGGGLELVYGGEKIQKNTGSRWVLTGVYGTSKPGITVSTAEGYQVQYSKGSSSLLFLGKRFDVMPSVDRLLLVSFGLAYRAIESEYRLLGPGGFVTVTSSGAGTGALIGLSSEIYRVKKGSVVVDWFWLMRPFQGDTAYSVTTSGGAESQSVAFQGDAQTTADGLASQLSVGVLNFCFLYRL